MMEAQLDEARSEMEMCEQVRKRAEGALGEVRMDGVAVVSSSSGDGGGGGHEQQRGEHTRKINGTAAYAGAPGDEHAKRLLWKLMTDIDIKSN